jgi:MFS family permease
MTIKNRFSIIGSHATFSGLPPLTRRNLLLITGYYFSRSLIFAYVIERLYWASKGISVGETVQLEIIYAIVLTIAEIPTGIWADRCGRKQSIVFSAVISLISKTLLLIGNSFTTFAVAIGLSAIYGALSSGAVNAFLYDSMLSDGVSDKFTSALASLNKWRMVSAMIAAIGGSFMASHMGMTLNYQLSVISCLFGVIFTIFLVEPATPKTHLNDEPSAWTKTYWVALKKLCSSHSMVRILSTGLLVGASIIYIDEFWQNYCQLIHIPIIAFGFISMSFSGIQILANHVIAKGTTHSFWEKHRTRATTVLGLTYALLLVGLGLNFGFYGLLLMAIAYWLNTAIELRALTSLHEHTESDVRAGVESIYSMLLRLASIGFGVIFGISNQIQVTDGYYRIGLILVLVIISMLVYTPIKETCHGQHRQKKSA